MTLATDNVGYVLFCRGCFF